MKIKDIKSMRNSIKNKDRTKIYSFPILSFILVLKLRDTHLNTLFLPLAVKLSLKIMTLQLHMLSRIVMDFKDKKQKSTSNLNGFMIQLTSTNFSMWNNTTWAK